MKTLTAAALLALLKLRDADCRAATSTDAFCMDLLTQASYELWERPIPIVESVQSNAALAVASGIIAHSAVGYGSYYKFYTGDPRNFTANRAVGQIWGSAPDGDGIHLACEASVTSVFALYRKTYPRYSATPVAVSTAYNTDDIVYDTGRTGSTGKCFRCVSGYTTSGVNATLNTELQDATKWEEQIVLDRLHDSLLSYARGIMKAGVNSDQQQAWFDRAEAKLEHEKRLFTQTYPWAVDDVSNPIMRIGPYCQ